MKKTSFLLSVAIKTHDNSLTIGIFNNYIIEILLNILFCIMHAPIFSSLGQIYWTIIMILIRQKSILMFIFLPFFLLSIYHHAFIYVKSSIFKWLFPPVLHRGTKNIATVIIIIILSFCLSYHCVVSLSSLVEYTVGDMPHG